MFLTDYDNRPGETHEKKVVEAFERYFEAVGLKDWFGILRYHLPFYDKNGLNKGRYEPDLVIFEKEKGLTVIEVKGLTIDQIEDILPNGWLYNNHYEVEKSPYTQAENQLYYLANKLEEDPLLYRRFSTRAIVAFPNITYQQWCEKGFDRLINVPPILFQDDIYSINGLEKIYSFNLQKSGAPLDGYRWNRVKEIFNVSKVLERDSSSKQDNSFVSNEFIFSKLYIIRTEIYWESVQDEIAKLLVQGTKIYILPQIKIDKTSIEKKFEKFVRHMQLMIYDCSTTEAFEFLDDTSIINAKGMDGIEERLSRMFPLMNMRQYLIAHGKIDSHHIVTASAGTGKTHVMIDRVLYLVLVENISPSKIDLITFTNESTEEMKQRLQEKLLVLFNLTNKTEYLNLAEELKDIRISTIHKYGESIISHFSHEFGLGRDFKVTGFENNKKLVIENLVHEYFQKENLFNGFKKLEYYKLIEYLKKIWSEMDKKGFSLDKLNNMDWGNTEDRESKLLIGLFVYVFERAENNLNQLKKASNSLDTNDLVKKLSILEDNDINLKNLDSGRYLFIDEFQDSDDSQIKFIAQLANKLNYRLFVVGDVKQSIYRFRGANSKAFDILKQCLLADSNISEYTLVHNYRTSETLMDSFEKKFIEWGKIQILPFYESKDKAKAVKKTEEKDTISTIMYKNANDKDKKIAKLLLDLVTENRSENGNNKKSIGVIVRTNSQAREVVKICKDNNIILKANLEGNFYKSDAVRHFKLVLEAFLFPNDAARVVRALQTPYFGYLINASQLIPFGGNGKDILEAVFSRIDIPFNDYVEQLKIAPLLTVFQKLTNENEFYSKVHSYYSLKNDATDNTIEVQQYRRNLHMLHNQIISKFGLIGNNAHDIFDWLDIQIKTNESENEPSINDLEAEIEVTTVHRAKGRQFDIVVMTATDRKFEHKNKKLEILFLDTDTDIIKVGWKIKGSFDKKLCFTKYYQNSYYTQIQKNNQLEINNEEMRLLYVALTRSKSQLYIFIENGKNDNTWGSYLGDL